MRSSEQRSRLVSQRMNYFNACTAAVFLALLQGSAISAQVFGPPKNALFTSCRPMFLHVAEFSDDAKEIGLTRAQLTNAVESRLRSARLFSDQIQEPISLRTQLTVSVHVVSNAFSILLLFEKMGYDYHTANFLQDVVWMKGSTGTHGQDAGYVVSALSKHVDEFLTEFLRANDSACNERH